MRAHGRIKATAFAGFMALSLGSATGAMAQPAPPAVQAAPRTAAPTTLPQVTFDEIMGVDAPGSRWNPTALGLGAIGGVVGYNMLAPVLIPASNALGGPLAGSLVADGAIAASRVYAISSAVAGAFVGQWLYEKLGRR